MTAKIKLNAASGGGSVSIQAPSSSSNNRVIALPDIADGTLVTSESTLDATKLSGNLPAISGAALTGISAGITEFDYWYLTSNKTDNSDITANLSRVALTGSAAQIGTGMSESSGIFTFPSTGKYLVLFQAQFEIYSDDNCNVRLAVTTNNSSYTEVAQVNDGNTGSSSHRNGSGTCPYFLDVTDTSNVKIKFVVGSLGSSSYLMGNSGIVYTSFTFVRIGGT
tara:strand:- start:26 stop:694 length:669 start_codon:yes stop_codon:yes gene_type:complete